ncbi:partial Alpha-D-kanosaminyltransferase, partial [Anaerolineae bacterium]
VNRYLYDNPLVAQHLKDYLAEWQPDIVHVTSCMTLSASVIAVAKQAGLPVVVTLTDFWFICPRVTLLRSDNTPCDGVVTEWECLECLLRGTKLEHWAKRILPKAMEVSLLSAISKFKEITRLPGFRGMAMDISQRRVVLRRALPKVDRVLIASQIALDFFRRNGFSIPIALVPYGHDLSWLKGYAGKNASSAIRFGFSGQIAAMKGPQLLIEAFRNAFETNKARLFIYGNLDKDPLFSQQLRSLAEGRADIEFRGTYPHSASAQVFADMDVLVVPSLWNDYPLIINEAFATQTPVIASDFGGMSEFVQHEVNGLLFKRGSQQDLETQLQRVIAEPDLLERLRAGIPAVKSMEKAVEEMIAIYNQLPKTVELAS